MIEVENVTKVYGDFKAVDSISFRVEKGEILGFLGPNGAGKSTTMRIITCFMPPTEGRASVEGIDCVENSVEVRKRIGYLPESAPLYKDMKVSEFLDFAASVKSLRGDEKRRAVASAMEKTEITDVQGKIIDKLSRGYRQRVGLAQALVGEPDVLILDEPTAGLDPKQIVDIRNVIKELSKERTIILSSHILPEVSILCDRVVIIDKGKIVAVDTPENLIKDKQKVMQVELSVRGDARADVVSRFIEALEGIVSVKALETVVPGENRFLVEAVTGKDIRGELSSAIVSKGFDLLELKPKLLSLEDVFMDIVTEEEMGEGDE
jgi:ABC-2 type transport system ATP-binding protein